MLAPALIAAVIAATPVATISTPTWSTTVTDEDVKTWEGYTRDQLQMLIQAAWTEGEAAERGITVSQAEIDEEAEVDLGLSRARQQFLARINLLEARLEDPAKQQAAQSVTPDQIEAYVAANPRLDPEQRRIKVLRTRSRAHAERALKALSNGLSWSSAARRYGRVRNRTIVRTQPLDGFEQRVLNTRKAKTTRYGSYVFRITKITPRRASPPAVQRAQAWEILSSDAQRQAIEAFNAELRAKWRPRTICAPAVQTHPDCGNPPTGE